MSSANEAPGARLSRLWRTLSPLPGGQWIFSRLLGRMVPYSGTIRPLVLELGPGHARVRLRDRRRVRNHLRSIHAVALANVGELATGLAALGALGPDLRGILTGLEITYVKKARGDIEAEARCEVPTLTEPIDHVVEAELRDASGELVATARARWRISPIEPRMEGRSDRGADRRTGRGAPRDGERPADRTSR
jgi:acyl-coenzyme A thioesterase PaaI-like protein